MPRRSGQRLTRRRLGLAAPAPDPGRLAVLAAVASAAAAAAGECGASAAFGVLPRAGARASAAVPRRAPAVLSQRGPIRPGRGVPAAGRRAPAAGRRAIFAEFVGELREGPNIFIGELAAVVVLSGLFEAGEHALRKRMADTGGETGQKILDSLFKEVTSLGYIGLFLFLGTKSGLAGSLVEILGIGGHHGGEAVAAAAEGAAAAVAGAAAEAPNPLAETFEIVRIMIFMLLTVLLLQAAAVLTASRKVLDTWLLTLVTLIPLVYSCVSLDFVGVEAVQCACAWSLLAAGLYLCSKLQEETYQLTPKVPKDGRQILRLLEGTNSAFAPTQGAQSNAVESPIPGLGDAEGAPIPTLRRPEALDDSSRVSMTGLKRSTYQRAFQIIAFWQACVVTSLIVALLSEPFENKLEIALYSLAWVEWPIMLFYVVPIFLRRFTMRNSIEKKKDMKTIRRVSLKTKEGLLKDFVRLFQIFTMAQRAKNAGEPWAVAGHVDWSSEKAKEKWEKGANVFREIPQADKLDIWKIYAAWDVNNDETVCANEISQTLDTLWVSADTGPGVETANSVIRLVDFDNTGTLSWRNGSSRPSSCWPPKTGRVIKYSPT
ncbi:unnamed protein product [Prorocentrum cordatum]|uniref:EF-hand domain-containing protein n=1 Tax=Prorocentrum cordatum TaxID=2364126 RepID=A0ABN9UDR6_9DINO|nr:unnamed protein product [Polarella glacialis]